MRTTPLLFVSSMLLLVACGGGGGNTDPDGHIDGGDGGMTPVDGGDQGSVLVAPTTALSLLEGGANGTFTLALADAPTADVTIALSSSDVTAATVSPASVTFTTANFATPQTITVAPVDDAAIDGAQAFTIVIAPATSTDARYAGVNAPDVAGSVADDDSPGFIVSAVTGAPSEAGATATFTVRLTKVPSANVAIAVTSSDTTEGTAAPAGLVFTPGNFDSPQTITIAPEDDDDIDGLVAWTVLLGAATSSDAGYQGLNPPDVSVSTIDDDEAAVTTSTPADTLCDVAASTTTFTLVLDARPSANVTFALSSVGGLVTPTPNTVTFTSENWDDAQTITVTWGGTNVAADTMGTIVIGAAQTTDPWYTVVDPDDVTVSLCDGENEAIIVTEVGGAAFVAPVLTHEIGTSDTFAVALAQPPAGDVTITLGASDGDEVSFAPATLTFTTANYATRQTVTVTGHGDAATDGTQMFSITLTPSSVTDAAYDALDALEIDATNAVSAFDFALGRPVVVNDCQLDDAGCPGPATPGALVDGDTATAYAFVEGFVENQTCGGMFLPPCPTLPTDTANIDIDLGMTLPGLEFTLTCVEATVIEIPIPALEVSADGVAYTPVTYVSGTPITVPGAVRYVRLVAASLSAGTTLWASGVDCSSLTAIGGADL